ncbi:hypothetical protein P8452_20532 [Trifolium repens]|nr:hypothetical protein P8452_20532 [Trifolium repens]
MTDIRILRHEPSTLSKLCRYAVDQSCGRLEDIYIKYFGTDDLLKYVADRSSNLRCLRIGRCERSMSKEGLYESLKKLPLLEELEILNCHLLQFVSFEVIGQCCPLLKSLNLKGLFDFIRECDDHALGIAQTMPGLRDLRIVKNNLTNAGLIAILDGCPLLESLDLRGCFHLDLSGSLGKRCNEQIKELLLPTDFIDESDDTFGENFMLMFKFFTNASLLLVNAPSNV